MKLQTLTIHNIASIEDATIDFSRPPLSDAEVFLITGKTGSGKSTILDAICLALYATTPRLSGTNMQGETHDLDEVKVNDPRQLMRRNTAEACVSLTFVGSNKVPYRAEWSVHRSKNKVDGRLQSKQWLLTNLTTDLTLTKDNEIKEEIQRAVGLDFAQFCRTTMLAQGEFTRFLNSKDDEKAAILEKITGADIYSKVGAKIFEITGAKKAAYENEQAKIKSVALMTDEEVQATTDKVKELTIKSLQLQQQSQCATAIQQWLQIQANLKENKELAQKNYDNSVAKLQSDEFLRQDRQVQQWQATQQPRASLQEQQQSQRDLDQHSQDLEKIRLEYIRLLGAKHYLQQWINNQQSVLDQLDATIQGQQAQAAIYQNEQALITHLETLDSSRREIDKGRAALAKYQQDLEQTYRPTLLQSQEAQQKAQTDLNTQHQAVSALEDKVAAANLNQLREQRDLVKDTINRINRAKDHYDQLEQEKARLAARRNQLEQAFSQIQNSQQLLEQGKEPLAQAKLKYDAAKELKDRQSNTIDKFAKQMRAKLKVGDVCPICNQPITAPLPLEADLEALFRELSQSCLDSETLYNNLLSEQHQLMAAIQTQQAAYQRDKTELENDNTVANATQKLHTECQQLGIAELSDTIAFQLDAMRQQSEVQQTRIEKQIVDGEALEQSLKAMRNQESQLRKAYDEAQARVQREEATVANCQSQIQSLQAVGNSLRATIEHSEQQIADIMTDTPCQINWREQPKAFAQQLSQSAQAYRQQVDQRQSLDGNLQTARQKAEAVSTAFQPILVSMPSWVTIPVPEQAQPIHNLLEETQKAGSRLAEVLAHRSQVQSRLEAATQRLAAYYATPEAVTPECLYELNKLTEAQIQPMAISLQALRDEHLRRQALLSQANTALEQHQSQRPVIEPDTTIESVKQRLSFIQSQLSELNKTIGAYNQQLDNNIQAKRQVEALVAQSEILHDEYLRWFQLDQMLGDAKGSKFRKIAQSYVLDSLIRSANVYMQTLTDRYTLSVSPGTFVISITDAYQGYTTRAASTISGGESFLVSLSLALALSDIGSQLQVDTLFIDEGFGTLSGEPLQRAIATLRTLHTHAGRHVGIISHVEELQERIPVQIQVRQEGNESRSTVEIIPN